MTDVLSDDLNALPTVWKRFAMSHLIWHWEEAGQLPEAFFDQLVLCSDPHEVDALLEKHYVMLAFNLEQMDRLDFISYLYGMAIDAHEIALRTLDDVT